MPKQSSSAIALAVPYVQQSSSAVIMLQKLQPIANRMAQNLEIISKIFQFSTRRSGLRIYFSTHFLRGTCPLGGGDFEV